uniref:Phosphoribosylaminoimidazole carboxylase; phosphoribosylaminoimidazolesuccinocarboxamide synthase n=1 Tax=Xenopus tropicalis TaxID=8364 RepID=A0A6I8QQX7_XENTR
MLENGSQDVCTDINTAMATVKEEPCDVGAASSSTTSEEQHYSHGADVVIKSEDDPELLDKTESSFRIVTVNEGGSENWRDHEVISLLHVCLDERICQQLEGPFQNKELFQLISQRMMEFGINKDWKQCRTKYKNLKCEYSLLKNNRNLHLSQENSMKFYDEVDNLMQRLSGVLNAGGSITGKRKSSRINYPEQSQECYNRLQGNAECQVPGKLKRAEIARTHTSDTSPNLTAIRKLGESPSRARFNNQLGSYQDVSGEQLQADQPEFHSYSSQFLQLQAKFKKNSILASRANKRCRSSSGKFRKVSKDIICLPAEYPEENCTYRVPRGTEREQLAMQGLIGKILIQSSWTFENFKTEVISLFQKCFKCKDQDFTFSFLQCLPGNRKLIKPNVSAGFKWSGIAIISLAAQGSLYIKTEHSLASPSKNVFFQNKPYVTEAGSDTDVASISTPPVKTYSQQKQIEAANWLPQASQIRNTVAEDSDKSGSQEKQREGFPDAAHERDYNQKVASRNPQGFQDLHIPLYKTLVQHCPDEREHVIDPKLGKKLREDEATEVYDLPERPGCVLIQSKDHMNAQYAAWDGHTEGNASVSNRATSCVFSLLQEAGIKTAFVKKCSEAAFIATQCEMIPIEWFCRRIASKRNAETEEGYRFPQAKVEMYKVNDTNNHQVSVEQLIAVKLICSGLLIGKIEVDVMTRSTIAIFEIIEKSWRAQDCTLVDMRIKFGVDVTKKEVLLTDIKCGSQALWPAGNKSQLKNNLCLDGQSRVVVLMASTSDLVHCEEIKKSCSKYGMKCELRVASAHTGPQETLEIIAEYEGDYIPTVFIAVAGGSNGLGAIVAANSSHPVINCPPLSEDWSTKDIWSSLRVPSGLGCSTVLSPEAAAQFAARIFGINSHMVWSKLRACTLNSWISLKQADVKFRKSTL